MSARHWALIAAMIALHLGFDALAPRLIRPGDDFAMATAIGLVVGQLNLVAIWSALATGKIIVRLPWAAFLAMLMWYALVFGNGDVDPTVFGPSDAIRLGFLLLCGALLTQPPLWIARLKFGWRLLPPATRYRSVTKADTQFSLGQLLGGMAVVGVAVGLGRLVLPPGELSMNIFGDEMLVLLSVVGMVNLMITAPCIWMAFARIGMLYGVVPGWAIYALVVSAVEVQVLIACLGPPGAEPVLMITWLINLTQCGVVLATVLLLRAIGFKLLRINKALEVSVVNGQNENHGTSSEALSRRGSDESTAPPVC